MFGGLTFLHRGNMLCGYEAALARANTREMDFTGRPLRGLVYVAPKGCRAGQQLEFWLERALDFSQTLPPK